MKIIGLEGIDGSGKSVQYDLLADYLVNAGYKVLKLSFPDYDGFFGKEIGKMLSGRQRVRADNVDARSMALWYALDRQKFFLENDNTCYDYIICNRYTLSNAVYQSARAEGESRENFIKWVFELEFDILKIPAADIYLLFDISPDISALNVQNKGFRSYIGNEADVYERTAGYMKNVRELYLKLAKDRSDIHIIDCMKENSEKMESIDEIHKKVIDLFLNNAKGERRK